MSLNRTIRRLARILWYTKVSLNRRDMYLTSVEIQGAVVFRMVGKADTTIAMQFVEFLQKAANEAASDGISLLNAKFYAGVMDLTFTAPKGEQSFFAEVGFPTGRVLMDEDLITFTVRVQGTKINKNKWIERT